MRYHIGGAAGLTCCDQCALALRRGRRRPGWPRPLAASPEPVGYPGWTSGAVEVLRYDRPPSDGAPGVCPLCAATRTVRQWSTAIMAEAHLPNAIGTPRGYPDDLAAMAVNENEAPDLGPVTAEEIAEEIRVAVDAQIARGWEWRGTRWSASERAQLRWSRLDTRAEALEGSNALPIEAANIDDTVIETLSTAAEIHEAAGIAEAWVVGWVGRVGAVAKRIVTAQPEALPAVLDALAADTPQAAGAALAALAGP